VVRGFFSRSRAYFMGGNKSSAQADIKLKPSAGRGRGSNCGAGGGNRFLLGFLEEIPWSSGRGRGNLTIG